MPPRDKVRFFPVSEVKNEMGNRSRLVGVEQAAWDALIQASKGPDIHYLKFQHDGRSFCLSSRTNTKNGTIDIEYGFIGAGSTTRVITTEEHRRCVVLMRTEGKSRRGPRAVADAAFADIS